MTAASGSRGAPARRNRGPAAAERNRRALLAAGRDLLATEGLAVPLSAVAKRAGVGQGSLYRHFPSRVALIAAVFEENLDRIEQFVATGERTLDEVFAMLVDQAVASTALVEAINAHRDDAGVARLGRRFAEVVDGVVEAERAAGRLADDITVDDIRLAIGMLAGEIARIDAAERAGAAARARRIVLAGLRPRP
ncbi:TetR/AcrR family transcriptional regulator [Microbacterium sp.]|uniref:TetR/AcrR family transcriptional regulator n=1 Tax=Microbacterium sp. TaxID=51671 RepID=UPI003A851B5C